jgi:hypothetical protein
MLTISAIAALVFVAAFAAVRAVRMPTVTALQTELDAMPSADRKRRVLHVHAGDTDYQAYTRMR